MGACCTHGVVLPPPDTVSGWQSFRVLGRGQLHVGFGNHLPVSPPPITDGVAGLAYDKGAGDNPARGTVGLVHHHPATERVSQQCETIPVVLKTTLKGGVNQPALPALP